MRNFRVKHVKLNTLSIWQNAYRILHMTVLFRLALYIFSRWFNAIYLFGYKRWFERYVYKWIAIFSSFFFKICFISMWIDTRTLSRDLDSRIDKRRLIFADPPLRVTQTKKGPLYCKKCLRSCFVNGQFNFVASNKQRPAKRMYLPNRARNLAFNVPFHANCHGKSWTS